MAPEKDAMLRNILHDVDRQEGTGVHSRKRPPNSDDQTSLTDFARNVHDQDETNNWSSPHESADTATRESASPMSAQVRGNMEAEFGSTLQPCSSRDTWTSREAFDGTDFNYDLGDSPLDARLNAELDRSQVDSTLTAVQSDLAVVQEDPSELESSNESLVDGLSNCISTLTIGPAGRTKLYGPSSTFGVEGVTADQPRQDRQPQYTSGLATSHRTDEEITAPDSLQSYLVSLYFEVVNSSLDMVDQEMYMAARAKEERGEDTAYASGALRNAMCAIGAAFESRHHQDFVTYPKSLVEYFAERARKLVEVELEHASVATVQAMMILSAHEVGNGNETRGWLYSGNSVRLAFDLALHLDLSHQISMGMLSPAEARVRQNVFWAVCNSDHALGFQYGRPIRISMEDVTVSKPVRSVQSTNPHVGFDDLGTAMSDLQVAECAREQRVTLCDLMAPCGYLLYAASKYSKESLQKMNASIVAQLCDWQRALPAILQIDLATQHLRYHRQVMQLHMQFHQNIIYAHRPWMSRHQLQPQPPRGPGYRHARGMCVHSAIAIARILNLYERQYTLRHIHHNAVHITSSAALLLLFADVCSNPEWENEDIVACLGTCFRALSEFSMSWQSASRASDTLLRIQQKWHSRKLSMPSNTQLRDRTGRLSNQRPSQDLHASQDVASIQPDIASQDTPLFDPAFDWSLLQQDYTPAFEWADLDGR